MDQQAILISMISQPTTHVSKLSSSVPPDYFAWLLYPVFFVLVFSFNFHALWLIYDLGALILLFHFILSRGRRVSGVQGYALAAVLVYFVIVVMFSGHVFMGLLSVWDTFKHLVYITLIFSILNFRSQARVEKLARGMYKTIRLFFMIQGVAVLMQYQMGFFFDDIAGTFGNGGSHAIGYISVLFVIAMIVQRKGVFAISSGIAFSLLMNLLSENAGYFVMLLLATSGIYFAQSSVRIKIKPKHIILLAIPFVLAYFMSGVKIYSERSFGETVIDRLVNTAGLETKHGKKGSFGRGSVLIRASEVGGWFGRGPGAYSDIYLLEGYSSYSMVGEQINISEATHLKAESGLVGYILTIALYTLFLFSLFEGIRYKVVASVLFLVCTYYSVVLMNESQFIMFLLMMFFFGVNEKRRLALKKHIRRIRALPDKAEA